MAMAVAGREKEGGRRGRGRVSSELRGHGHAPGALAKPYHAVAGWWAAAGVRAPGKHDRWRVNTLLVFVGTRAK